MDLDYTMQRLTGRTNNQPYARHDGLQQTARETWQSALLYSALLCSNYSAVPVQPTIYVWAALACQTPLGRLRKAYIKTVHVDWLRRPGTLGQSMLMPTTAYLAVPSILSKDLISIYPIRRNEEPANRFTAWRDRGAGHIPPPDCIRLHQIFISNPATKGTCLSGR
ncbi:hypothetical protein TESG_01670 [Trichophyton tonsurans CBS 112818]|uniref:Uncharacterized protein n=1 Tax=Trichophyton tonsurans (strain CBS 112818) TaxID=647933 RepID=F2RS47_TRIT1|nr:hypothetical protein TESG_01670 [Trichophyton tonsurans CBS 112818]